MSFLEMASLENRANLKIDKIWYVLFEVLIIFDRDFFMVEIRLSCEMKLIASDKGFLFAEF